MFINKKGRTEKWIKEYYPLWFVFLVSIILIVLPFIFTNNLGSFDNAGQYASAYYIRSAFWPWPEGWNSMMLTGFPQGLFYPPFFHWLTAAVSFLMPLQLAYKLILSLAILVFPLIYFVLVKKIFLKSNLANLALLFVSIFYYFDLGLNDNLFCDLYFGMSPHLFSLTLFIGYLYFLWSFYQNKGRWQWAAISLSLVIVTHAITGLMGIIFGIIFLLISWKYRQLFVKTVKHLVLAALLSLWWWLPMLLNLSYVSGSDITSAAPSILILLLPFILVISLAVITAKNEKNIFLKTVAIFNFLIIIVYLLGRIFPIYSFPVHVGRFLVYPLLLVPLSLIGVVAKFKYNWQKINLALVFVFSFYFFFFRIIPVGPFDTVLLDNLKDYYKQGRIIVTGDSRYLDDRFHITRTKLTIEKNIPTSEGLFVESSANGWFIMSMMQSWDNVNPTFTWAYKHLSNVADLRWGADIMAINYEYRISDLSPSQDKTNLLEAQTKIASSTQSFDNITENEENNKEIAILNFKNERIRLLDNEKKIDILASANSPFYYQTLYKVGNYNLAETLTTKPTNIISDWRVNTRRWWSSDWLRLETADERYKKSMLIYQQDTSDWQFPATSLNLPLSLSSQNMDTFVLDATALETSAPIYIKIAYFPFWKAFDETGRQLEIYKASPNFMIVYGRGKITFKYIEPDYYFAGFIVSGLALLTCLTGLIFLRPKD